MPNSERLSYQVSLRSLPKQKLRSCKCSENADIFGKCQTLSKQLGDNVNELTASEVTILRDYKFNGTQKSDYLQHLSNGFARQILRRNLSTFVIPFRIPSLKPTLVKRE